VPVAVDGVYLERIKQIKTEVNSRVGNPVNLVDIDNQVGREYMNALLEAMKKLSSGAVSEMAPAMQRLEAALVAVRGAIERHGVNQTAVIEEKSGPGDTVVSEPTNNQTNYPRSVNESSVGTESKPVLSDLPVSTKKADSIISVASQLERPTRPVPSPTPTPTPPPPTPPAAPAIPRPIPPARPAEESGKSGFEAGADQSQTLPRVSVNQPPASLASSAPLKTPSVLPDPASLETSPTGDPLYTKEVDDGLEQLLSDWSLFKKSGLFGTGPHGRQHPLYKKVSDLQVPLLLAGRFDGATQEIRQSITDYMNGWRYEQGIIYQPGETFENYLRRVIRHILDLQKKRKGT
jgi:hypothetical protein